MRFFVTGISGFAGSHLSEILLDRGHAVHGISRQIRSRSLEALHERFGRRFPIDAVRPCDIRDGALLRETLRRVKPDGVFHLAGMAFVPRAAQEPMAAYEVNLLGSIEVLAAVREAAPEARVVLPSSGEIYGWVQPSELPIVETQPLRPISSYSVGKAAADLAGFQFFWSHGLDVVRARPFNHTGPGQSPDFVCSEFARAVAAAETGVGPRKLCVGNLDVERDFSDVRDVVRGYLALFEKGVAGEAYNLASGRAVAVRSILDRLLGESQVEITVETDPKKVRPKELQRIQASISKVSAATGWQPEIPLEKTLSDLLAYWRDELAG